MSVTVQNLTKIFGTQRAVDAVSFEASKGSVLGFLGPNGAGKSTTMKIISCYIPQTEGQVQVCGFSVSEDPMEVRKRIGYLPEHNPLYKEMYVREYLEFVGKIHRLDQMRTRVDRIIERTGLGLEQHKKIGALSKGYRQRVGLAQAMLHDPEVLILDEPTSGLDPNQLVEIRNLIKALGREKTVILSTHIMQEVQAVCDQVVIINRGKIVANDPIERLRDRTLGQTVLTIQFLEQISVEKLQKLDGVQSIEPLREPNRFVLRMKGDRDYRPSLFNFAKNQNLTLIELNKEISSVEDVFHQLTKN